MNKKYGYIILGVVVVAALVFVAFFYDGSSKQSANIFNALSSTVSEPPITMNSVDPAQFDQTNYAIESESYDARLSDDGSHIVFVTRAAGGKSLVPNPTSATTLNSEQVYRRNLATGTVDLVSSTDGTAVNAARWGQVGLPGISTTGRYVAFVTSSWDSSNQHQVYIKDMQTGTLTLASSVDGTTGQPGNKYNPQVSADGRRVCWGGGGTPAVNTTNINCKNLVDGTLTVVATVTGDSEGYAELSANGKYISYFSGNSTGIKRADLENPTAPHAQVSDPTTSAYRSKISDDGNIVAWVNNSNGQVMVKNMTTGSVTVASVNAAGQNGSDAAERVGISGNGRFVVFSSRATNLIPGVTGLQTYIKDLNNLSAEPVLCSARNATDPAGTFNPDGEYGTGDQGSDGPTVNNDATLCAFVAANDGGPTQLIKNDGNSAWNYNVYVKGLGTPSTTTAPAIVVSTSSITLSTTPKGTTNGQIGIANTGTAPLNLTVTLDDPSKKFSIIQPTTPVAPGDSTVIVVTFTPGPGRPSQQFTGSVTITHDATTMASPVTIPITGIRVR